MKNKDIQFFFNRQDRAVNSGRITGIRNRSYGPEVASASDEDVTSFISRFQPASIVSPSIALAHPEPEQADPISEKVLRSFFAKDSDGSWRCAPGETDQFECKASFNLKGFGKPLKTIAGFANSRGGYLFFGVKDKPDNFLVCGLADDRFTETDQNKFTQTIRAALQPTPRFCIATLKLDDLDVGVIYVESHRSKPIIAGKTEGDLIEGFIYFRYPGETRPICYADLRAILDERDQKGRESILPMVQRLLELGPKDALVANLLDGQLEGAQRPILIDPHSLKQIKFIREGEFVEEEGAPTLRVIGEAQTLPAETSLPIRTVREEVTVDAILRNFINRTSVERPLSYFNQISHENGWIFPVFYYLHLAGQSRSGAITTLKTSKVAKPKTRAELIKLLTGKRTLYTKLGGERASTFDRIRASDDIKISTPLQAKNVCSALTGAGDWDSKCFDHFHDLLAQSLSVWEAGDGDATLLAHIRRAAARLDELEYGALVPID